MNTKHCLNCGDPDTHFEKKFCSVLCADIYDGICDAKDYPWLKSGK